MNWYRKAAEAGSVAGAARHRLVLSRRTRHRRDLTAAALWSTKAADAGDAAAQSNLAYLYANGAGVARDDAKAAEFYRKAAQQGLVRAQVALALFHETGRGVARDEAEAAKLYREAAVAGNEAAQARLGRCMLRHDGAITDRADAAQWIHRVALSGTRMRSRGSSARRMADRGGAGTARRSLCRRQRRDGGRRARARPFTAAAEKGDAFAQLQLGLRYARGDGVAQSYVQAHKWVNLAAAAGDAEAAKSRDVFAKLMTADEVAEAQRLAREWSAARQGTK